MRRVVLKSPVLENCTPGSVRGAPGNRRPYLDNAEMLKWPAWRRGQFGAWPGIWASEPIFVR